MKKILIITCLLFFSSFAKAQTIWTEETKLKGTIGKYDIFMTLAVPYGGATGCLVIGKYHYGTNKKYIDLCSEEEGIIVERINNKETGYFLIYDWNKSVGQTVTGLWTSMDGRKQYAVKLKVVGKGQY